MSKPAAMTTISGVYLNPNALRVSDVNIQDISHSLSLICRYNGHVSNFYSVAEHCLILSNRVYADSRDNEKALAALLHDAAEAYLGDIITGLKYSNEMKHYRSVEERTERVIEKKFGLQRGALADPAVKTLDKEVIAWEQAIFCNTPWRTPTPPAKVAEAYLTEFNRLTGAINRSPNGIKKKILRRF